MNSINNNIQFTYKIENNDAHTFLDSLVSPPIKASQHLSIAKTSLFPYIRICSCHPFSHKMSTLYTFVNHKLNICLDPISFHTGIRATGLDGGYNP